MTTPKPLGEQAKDFFYYLGVAITDWAHVDQELFGIFGQLLKSDQTRMAILYYRTNTIGARLEMVNDLLDTAFPKPERKNGGHPHPSAKCWHELKKEISSELRIRNQLAHCPSMPVFEGYRKGPGILDTSWASYVSATERLTGKMKPELKVADIEAHLKRLSAIFIRIRDFRLGELPKLLGSPP